MRVESDQQGHYTEAPACHRCGVPLLEESTFCPYCERWLDDPAGEPRSTRRRDAAREGFAAVLTERALLTAGFVFFAIIAAVCIAAALLV